MTGEARSYALDISEHLFHLTTESLRLHSNATQQYQSLTSLVSDRISGSDPLDDHAPETIRQHLTAVPTTGDIRINLNITESSAGSLDEVKHRLAQTLGSELTIGDTLSILLFHYVVEQKANGVLKRLALEEALDTYDAAEGNEAAAGNVLPIR